MKEILTSQAECYSLQRLAILLNQQDVHIAELWIMHGRGESFTGSRAIQELLVINAEIKSLMILNTLLAGINERAAQWGAVAPEFNPEADECRAVSAPDSEIIPFCIRTPLFDGGQAT
jgi:hypothetical protein